MTPEDKIEALYKEIERKDKQIEKLKEENSIIMKTALKAEERLKEMEKKLLRNN
jgi:hypothetical protein